MAKQARFRADVPTPGDDMSPPCGLALAVGRRLGLTGVLDLVDGHERKASRCGPS